MRFGMLICLLSVSMPLWAKTLIVGPGGLAKPSDAAAIAHDGDVVEIHAGVYNDVAVWRANNLTLRGVGARPVLDAAGQSAEGKALWVIKGANTTVQNLEFTGCRSTDKNGAGIRQEGPGLTIRGCRFHGNQMGVLTGANPQSDVVLEYSEFDHNGYGDGLSHNIYIGRVRSFTLRGCYSHHARIGHLVKSRAETNLILYNRLTDEVDGNSSYVLDLPNGGRSIVIGNLMQHGPRAENGAMISYALEGAANPVQELYVVHNSCVSDRQPGRFLRIGGANPRVALINNLGVGAEWPDLPGADIRRNLTVDTSGFVDAAHQDYRLKPSSPARGAGVDPGKAGGYPLAPELQYVHPCQTRKRPKTTRPNVGAY